MSRKSSRKRPKKTDENFLDWNELDRLCEDVQLFVDEDECVLEEVTTTTTSECSSSLTESSRHKGPGVFQCSEPECGKAFKTISGFKSHMSKIHKTTEKQAFNHERGKSGISSPACLTSQRRIWDEATFNEKKLHCIEMALQTICNDELLGMSEGDGQDVQKMASAVIHTPEKLESIADLMYPVIQHLGTSGNYSLDAERMFRKFHRLAMNIDAKVTDSLQSVFPDSSKEMFTFFVQVFLRELRDSVFSALVNQCEKTTELSSLTEADQNVICYISGYILCALKKRYKRFQSEHFQELRTLLTIIQNKPVGSLSQKYSDWITATSRGGLIVPPEHFFLLVRELENVTRVSELSGVKLKETLLTSFMVMHNWAQLIAEQTPFSAQLLEHCVELFIKVRGYAFAKLQKRSIACQANKALRKVLKEKTNLKY